MSGHCVCPSCGYDLEADKPIILGDYSIIGPGYPICYRNRPIVLTPAEANVCAVLMKVYPRALKPDALLTRLGSESDYNLAEVFICRIRQKFKRVGLASPIDTLRAVGYRWRPTEKGPQDRS